MKTRVSLLRSVAPCVALAFLAAGCITYSGDKAVARMSEQEKAMFDQLSKISKGMTKGEVREILGPPGNPESKDTWRYGMNPKTSSGTMVVYTPSTTLSTVKGGQFTGGTTTLPATVTTVPYSSETIYESMARVFFKNDRVTRIDFAHPGMGDDAFAFDVLK